MPPKRVIKVMDDREDQASPASVHHDPMPLDDGGKIEVQRVEHVEEAAPKMLYTITNYDNMDDFEFVEFLGRTTVNECTEKRNKYYNNLENDQSKNEPEPFLDESPGRLFDYGKLLTLGLELVKDKIVKASIEVPPPEIVQSTGGKIIVNNITSIIRAIFIEAIEKHGEQLLDERMKAFEDYLKRNNYNFSMKEKGIQLSIGTKDHKSLFLKIIKQFSDTLFRCDSCSSLATIHQKGSSNAPGTYLVCMNCNSEKLITSKQSEKIDTRTKNKEKKKLKHN